MRGIKYHFCRDFQYLEIESQVLLWVRCRNGITNVPHYYEYVREVVWLFFFIKGSEWKCELMFVR